MRRLDVPVLIVGGGPTGLTAGILLSRLGVGHHLVERRPGPQRAPAAHAVNARTFEIWRQAGVDMDAVLASAKSPADAGAVYWVTRLGGEVLGHLPYERQGDDVLALTPTPLRNLSQHRLEPLLRATLDDVGAGPHYGHQWESAVQDADGVTSRLRDLATDETYEVRSRWLVAADGAGSPVRRSVGIQPVGPDHLQRFIMIHVEANLRALVADRPGVLYWVCDPDCTGTFVAHDIDREWVFMRPWDEEAEPLATFDAAHCEAVVRRAIVRDDVSLTVRTVSPWTMTCQVAERYRDGRILLAGDAAHRFPPTGGMGLNTGVQDAHNLMWKIAAVERGWAGPGLLDSYEEERQPIARYNAEQSFSNAARLMEVPQAMGTAAEPEVARRQFAAMLADPARRAEVGAAIADQAEHFDMLGLQLGFSYAEGALVADGSPPPERANPVREFVPTSRPGARLPHGWVTVGGRRASTLDLVQLDTLTLLVGPAGEDWADAADDAGVPVRVLRLGRDVGDPDGWWTGVAGMTAAGALLVRPDQHVAFRSRGAALDPRAALGAAVAAATARSGDPGGRQR